jgi:hypothetical protein
LDAGVLISGRPGRENVDVWGVLGGQGRDPTSLGELASDKKLTRNPRMDSLAASMR